MVAVYVVSGVRPSRVAVVAVTVCSASPATATTYPDTPTLSVEGVQFSVACVLPGVTVGEPGTLGGVTSGSGRVRKVALTAGEVLPAASLARTLAR